MNSKEKNPDAGQQRPDHHHRNVMIIATVAVVVLLIAMVWVVQMIIAQQKLERCLATGRRDCLQIAAPPRNENSNPQR